MEGGALTWTSEKSSSFQGGVRQVEEEEDEEGEEEEEEEEGECLFLSLLLLLLLLPRRRCISCSRPATSNLSARSARD